MTYNPNIPQATDVPAFSQSEILTNFGVLNTQFGVNHLPFTTTSGNAGYHTVINFPTGLGSDPNLISPISSLYVKLISSIPQLFFQNGALAGNVQQLTGAMVITSGGNNFVQTPFGIKLAWGSFTASGTTSNVTFSGTFGSIPGACVAVQTGNVGGSRACVVNTGSLSTTGVQIIVSNSGNSGYYFAIGV